MKEFTPSPEDIKRRNKYREKMLHIYNRIGSMTEEEKTKIREDVKLFYGEIPSDEAVKNIFRKQIIHETFK
jgi:truncated hemoglobin YjbI